MKILSQATLQSLKDYVTQHCRPLEAAYFGFLLGETAVAPFVAELQSFQNPDGGFGHGLEPDFWLPDSSPMATSMAFRWLTGLPVDKQLPLIQRGIDYYEATFRPAGQQWLPTGPAVNQHPHAPWWHRDETPSADSSDSKGWDGNPSAEIIGHVLRYRGSDSQLDLDALVGRAIAHLAQQERYETHEIQCYLKLYGQLPANLQAEVLLLLRTAVLSLVVADTSQWGDYVPKPLDFVDSPESVLYADLKDLVSIQLDALVEEIEQTGFCAPTWTWGGDDANWQKARQWWIGVLTCDAVAKLKHFGRLEGLLISTP
mgnify:CR=1 FL=1